MRHEVRCGTESDPVESIEHVLAETDLVCLMSVNPGFGGQKFIESTYEKVRRPKP